MTKTTGPKILYVGAIHPGSTALHRMQALHHLGCATTPIDVSLPNSPPANRVSLIERVKTSLLHRTDVLVDWQRTGYKILKMTNESWDVLWIDKGLSINPKVLKTFKKLLPSCTIISYSPDDMFNKRNQSRRYLRSLRLYDVVATTKSFNVAEFNAAGVRNVVFVEKSYEPTVHFPKSAEAGREIPSDLPVVFVGSPEPQRKASIEYLASRNIPIKLFGAWLDLESKYENVRCVPGFRADDQYREALQSGSIALCFLRKVNRDQQTARSVEIPACGVFMLAERTQEHMNLFQEGVEAEFFSTNEELYSKTLHYLSNRTKRDEIALAGRRRCERSGYSNAERLRSVLRHAGIHVPQRHRGLTR